MEIQQAREEVVSAGHELVKAGLIARTWGNVSARISESQFVITPSGRAYETLTPAEIVAVNIADGSYSGEIKPSSEKGLHAAVYQQRPEVNFIIHTHQLYASVVSALHRDIEVLAPDAAAKTGSRRIPCASYGLPGSKKLKKGVVEALSRSEGKAFLMANHGALCLGADRDETFKVATALEQICEDYIMRRYLQLSGREDANWDALRAYYLAELAPGGPFKSAPPCKPLYNSEREGSHFRLCLNATPGEPFPEGGEGWIKISLDEPAGSGAVPPEAEIHRFIYRNFKGIRVIIHDLSPDILILSQAGQAVYPLLDDFAQIVGVSARVAASNLPEIARKLKGRYSVLIENNGALCCGPSRSDAAAAAQVLDKGCLAVIGTAFFGGARPIHPVESLLMRLVYLAKYSKKAAG
ncbi:MAG TPA: class II aldolase/adducin family protein [Bacillota bacterium]|nr:hypothetical protein [Bacillota bacterium]HOA35410.1 class II aldolase/adducin family protein [Bacillota bacterium]HOJ84717.1 class II aldolase/adducin family protein [Bacillota bacterium]HOL15113.1 class II aldolase/adducin family protein [Bacillota bacterium]HPZ11575.1 class II aldolase/adducin family protein [Bacillota bacterium]